jgi:hypothetical protein
MPKSKVFHSFTISYHSNMIKRRFQNPGLLTRAGFILKHAGIVALGLAMAMLNALHELFASAEVRHDEQRRLHDSDLAGEFNHRTGRLDAGTDPYCRYDD